jgi:hypothetical protein
LGARLVARSVDRPVVRLVVRSVVSSNSYADLVHFKKKKYDMQKWDSDGFSCRILEH